MGQSRLERFYAFVQTSEGDLGEQLARNGLARNYGFKAVPPGLKNSRLEIQKLQQFEDEARQEKIGGWGINVGRLNTRALSPIAFSVFVSEQRQPRTTRPAHSTVSASAMPTPSTPIAANNPAGSSKSHAKAKTP
ncbi:MAG: hypothetical protein DMF33_12820, partial [Verrucomicrobia bacterium]